MELQTKKRKKHVINLITAFMLGCILLACSGGDSGDNPEPTPSAPTLSLNPSDFEFDWAERDSKNLEIKTDADWTVIYCPEWLSCSSKNGKGSTTITLTTTSENKDDERSDQIEIKATSSGKEITQRVSVKQKSPYPKGCEVNIPATSQLVMSYGMACVVEFGNNTQHFYYKIYSDADYSNIKGNDSQIVQDATKSGTEWKRENIPSSGGIEICYDQCQPKTRYVFVAVPFTSSGKNGKIYTNEFMTKPKEEEPLATIKPVGQVANEVHDGDTGPWYKWEVKKESGTCNKYYTYACASNTEFDMMKNHKGDFGQYDERDGVKVAWNIWLEHKGDQTTHTTTFNKGNSGGREKLFRSYSEGATQWLTAKTTDKYLQIVTWGVDENNNYSGIVYDVIYKVENGRLYPNPGPEDPDLILEASPTSLQFSAVGGTEESKSITVNSNTEWTVSSSKDWCVLDRTFGSNSGSINVHVEPYDDTSSPRSALITITSKSSGKYVEVQVTQNAKEVKTVIGRDEWDDNDKNLDGGGTTTYTLSVGQSSISTLPAGETKNISVTSNDSWTASSNQSWCTVSPTSGSNNGTIKVTTSKNTSSNSRSATITVKGAYSGSKTITVSQNAYTLSISSSSLKMIPAGESYTVSITSNDSWTVSSSQSWCTASPASGSNNGTIRVTASKNTSSSSRSATITIKGANSGSKTITVSQDAYTLSISSSSLQIKSEGESKTVSITSNDSWTATCNQSWCTVSPSSGSNNGSITIKATSNSSSSRTATVTVKGTNSGRSVTVSVSQEAGTVIGRDEYGTDKVIK